MMQSPNGDLECWRPPQSPFPIFYSRLVLEQIRLAVVDAYFLVPRGGLEIGGVLLGRYHDRHLEVLGHEPLECEHAFGPSFSLSPRDQERLKDLLAKARHKSGGFEPVGWYHSHTRSEICLTESDLGIHDTYFPEMWQVALVLRPSTSEPARAGFFFRELGGSIRAAASYHEFKLEPLGGRPKLLKTEAESRIRESHGAATAADPASVLPPPEPRPRVAERILRPVQERPAAPTARLRPALEPLPAPSVSTPPRERPVPLTAEPPPRPERPLKPAGEALVPALTADGRQRPDRLPPNAPSKPPLARPVSLTPPMSPPQDRQPAPLLVESPAPESVAPPVEVRLKPERQATAVGDPAASPKRPATPEPSPEPVSVPVPVKRLDPTGVELPRFLRNEPPPQSGWTRVPLFIAAMLFLFVALGGLVFVAGDAVFPRLRAFLHRSSTRASTRPAGATPARIGPAMSIAAVDNLGQLQIRWDTGLPSVQEAQSAVLSIMDGGPPQRFPLDVPHLRAGAFTYKRHGARVDVRLSILSAEGGSVEAATTFLGPPLAEEADAVPSDLPAAALAKQNAKLRRQLDEQIARNKTLQAQLERLRKQRAGGLASRPVNLR
jgi:proteasome lid subunit RPN8/RPN11